jgi:hypothetical protein
MSRFAIENEAIEHKAFVLKLFIGQESLAIKYIRDMYTQHMWVFTKGRLFELCVGLQSLELPALVLCRIAKNSSICTHQRVPFHRFWLIVTKIKHWKKQE